jgi:hypothetical protein
MLRYRNCEIDRESPSSRGFSHIITHAHANSVRSHVAQGEGPLRAHGNEARRQAWCAAPWNECAHIVSYGSLVQARSILGKETLTCQSPLQGSNWHFPICLGLGVVVADGPRRIPHGDIRHFTSDGGGSPRHKLGRSIVKSAFDSQ